MTWLYWKTFTQGPVLKGSPKSEAKRFFFIVGRDMYIVYFYSLEATRADFQRLFCLFPWFWVLFSKIWELPDGLFCHFLQKCSTNLAVLKEFCKKPNSHCCYFNELQWHNFACCSSNPIFVCKITFIKMKSIFERKMIWKIQI